MGGGGGYLTKSLIFQCSEARRKGIPGTRISSSHTHVYVYVPELLGRSHFRFRERESGYEIVPQLRRAGSRLLEGGCIIPLRKEEAKAFIIVY